MGLQLSRTQTRFRTKEFIAAAAAIFVAAGAMASLSLQVGAEAPNTVVVTPSNEKQLGWEQTEFGEGKVDYINSSGALGFGALEFTTDADGDYTRIRNDIKTNVALSSINNLSYKTQRISGAEGIAAVNLRLYIDTNSDGDYDDVLVYEPYYNRQVKDTGWESWEITQTEGLWWSNYANVYNGKGGVGAGSNESNFTLADVVAQYSDVKIDEYGLGTGTSNFPWVVQADALKINDTTYDFERNVKTSAKDECKNGGWLSALGLFKNQGQCVSGASNKNK